MYGIFRACVTLKLANRLTSQPYVTRNEPQTIAFFLLLLPIQNLPILHSNTGFLCYALAHSPTNIVMIQHYKYATTIYRNQVQKS